MDETVGLWLLEPSEAKVSRTVLRGEGRRKAALPPDLRRGFDSLHPLHSNSQEEDMDACSQTGDVASCDWQSWTTIPWDLANQYVRRLQARISKAALEQDWRGVKRLQRLLVHSTSGKALAMRALCWCIEPLRGARPRAMLAAGRLGVYQSAIPKRSAGPDGAPVPWPRAESGQ